MQDRLSRIHSIISRPPIVLHPAGVVRCSAWPEFYSSVLSQVFEVGSHITAERTKEIITAAKREHFYLDDCSPCEEVIEKWLKLLSLGDEGSGRLTAGWKPLSKCLKVSAGRWEDMEAEEVVSSSPSPLPRNMLLIYSRSFCPFRLPKLSEMQSQLKVLKVLSHPHTVMHRGGSKRCSEWYDFYSNLCSGWLREGGILYGPLDWGNALREQIVDCMYCRMVIEHMRKQLL
jgi:hypothetical protein